MIIKSTPLQDEQSFINLLNIQGFLISKVNDVTYSISEFYSALETVINSLGRPLKKKEEDLITLSNWHD